MMLESKPVNNQQIPIKTELRVAQTLGKALGTIQAYASLGINSILPELNSLTPFSSKKGREPKRSGDPLPQSMEEKNWRAGLRKTHPNLTEKQIKDRIERQKRFLDSMTIEQHMERIYKQEQILNDYKAGKINSDQLKAQLTKLAGPIAEE